jgi:hypothetical protein
MLIILFFVACVIGFFHNLFTGHLADAAALFVTCGTLIFFARWVAKEKEQAVEFSNGLSRRKRT